MLTGQSEIKLTFAGEVKVVYFEQSTDESCTQSIHLFIKMISQYTIILDTNVLDTKLWE